MKLSPGIFRVLDKRPLFPQSLDLTLGLWNLINIRRFYSWFTDRRPWQKSHIDGNSLVWWKEWSLLVFPIGVSRVQRGSFTRRTMSELADVGAGYSSGKYTGCTWMGLLEFISQTPPLFEMADWGCLSPAPKYSRAFFVNNRTSTPSRWTSNQASFDHNLQQYWLWNIGFDGVGWDERINNEIDYLVFRQPAYTSSPVLKGSALWCLKCYTSCCQVNHS